MQIVFLIHDIHLGGGGERVTVNLANYLADNGYKVTITSLSAFKPKNIFEIDKRVTINYLNFNFDQGLKIPKKIGSVFKVRAHFRKCNDQAIILGIGTYPSLLLALLSKKTNIKTIGCQHLSYSAIPKGWHILGNIFFNRLNCLVSLTERDLHRLKRLNRNARVIPNAVSFYPEKPALLANKTILAIGRLDHVKGYDLLLDVFERFSILDKDWCLRIVGEGPQKLSIGSRVNESGLKGRVKILPATSSIVDEYLNSSIYIMTSRAEGFPMVLLEAQACGLPIISFNCETGPAEIIHNGIDGYLVDCFDVDEMVIKLQELCFNEEKRIDFGIKARESSKRFFPEKINKKWEELFKELGN